MIKTRKFKIVILVAFLIGCLTTAGAYRYFAGTSRDDRSLEGVQKGFPEALMTLLNDTSESDNAEVKGVRRLSQKLTVTTKDGVVPVTGTVTKAQDAFYPGTYEIKFSDNALLGSNAVVQVAMNVKKGDKVYILTGDKNSGYTEYAAVVATENNVISFSTNILQDYTLSTTDIDSAQQAMADIFSTGY